MRLKDAGGAAIVGGASHESDFTFHATPFMASLMSDKLYSDKVLAVVREYLANAKDSHRDAGKADVPFLVQLPTALEPEFVVEDYGTGLSPENTIRLMSGYGASEKQDSNDFIGGFGVGSKAGFAYTDQFTVEARWEGKVYLFTCVMNKGLPKIVQKAEAPTHEPNGLTIRIPVKSRDFRTFAEKVAYVTSRWDVKPKVVGGNYEPQEIEYAKQDDGWGLREAETGRGYYGAVRSSYAIVGGIPYPISPREVDGLNDNEKALLSSGLDLFFDVGEVDVAASREALSYDTDTQRAILRRVRTAMRTIASEYADALKDCSSMYEAKLEKERLRRQIDLNLWRIISASIKWQGRAVSGTHITLAEVKYEDEKDAQGNILRKTPVRQGFYLSNYPKYQFNNAHPRVETHRSDLVLDVTSDAVVVLNDVGRKVRSRILYDVTQNGAKQYVVVTPDVDREDGLDNAIEQLEGYPYIMASDMAEPPKKEYQRKKNVRKLIRFEGGEWKDTEHDVSEGGVYVPLYAWEGTIAGRKFGPNETRHVIGEALRSGLLPEGTVVYGIPATHKTIPEKYKGWVPLGNLLMPKLVEANRQMATKNADRDAYMKLFRCDLMEWVRIIKQKTGTGMSSGLVGEIDKAMSKTEYALSQSEEEGTINRLVSRFCLKAGYGKPSVPAQDLVRRAKEACPLLKHIPKYEWDDERVRAVSVYISQNAA